jgi:putative transposase
MLTRLSLLSFSELVDMLSVKHCGIGVICSGLARSQTHDPRQLFRTFNMQAFSFEEWKREEELVRRVKEHSARYGRHPSLGYRSAPGEVAAEALGLLYRVRSSRELSAVFIQNLLFLEDYKVAWASR